MKISVETRAKYEAFACAIKGYAREVLGEARPEDFDSDDNHAFYHAMSSIEELLLLGSEVTLATICDKLKSSGRLNDNIFNELENASEISGKVDPSASAKLVAEYAARRRLQDVFRQGINDLEKGKTSAEISSKITGECFQIAIPTGRPSLTLREAVVRTREKHEILRSGEILGYRFGIPTIDKRTMGIQRKECANILGPAGSGKSIWLLQMMLINALVDGNKCALYNLEMSVEDVIDRAIAMKSRKLRNALLLRGYLDSSSDRMTDEEWEEVSQIEDELMNCENLYIDDSKRDQWSIFSDIERRVQKDGVELIGIDYTKLIQTGLDDEFRALSKLSSLIKDTAQRLNVAIVQILSLDKASMTAAYRGEKTKGGAYGSSSFTYDASLVFRIRLDDPVLECRQPGGALCTRLVEAECDPSVVCEGMLCGRCREKIKARAYGEILVEKARGGKTGYVVPIMQDTAKLRIKEIGGAKI